MIVMTHTSFAKHLPRLVRISSGSAIVLQFLEGKLDAAPTTAYLMTYKQGKCTANCGFCPQARKSRGRTDMLSRVSWPAYPTDRVVKGIYAAHKKGHIKRVCVQALNYAQVFDDLLALANAIYLRTKMPISISCQPLNRENIKKLAEAGVERIGIPLDAATKDIFDKVKGRSAEGPYIWEKQFELLRNAVGVFGKGKVSTHLIVGLGETEQEVVSMIQTCLGINVLPALFAFTPIFGTAMENRKQPPIQSYRRIQVARHLILEGEVRAEEMDFDDEGCLVHFGVSKEKLAQTIKTGKPFLTSGCPGCNRPYYNEKPSGPIYNCPKPLTDEELAVAVKELGSVEMNL